MPALATALIISALAGAGGTVANIIGGNKQAEALSSAQASSSREARRLRQLQQQQFAFQQRVFEEGQPLRQESNQAAIEAIQALLGQTQAPIGEGQQFQRNLSSGFRNLAGQASQFGVNPNSSFFERAGGELTGSLIGQEENQRLGILQLLAGGGKDTSGLAPSFGAQGVGLAGQAAGAQQQASQLGIAQGALQGQQASALGSIPGNIGNMLLISQLLGGGSGKNPGQNTTNQQQFLV